MIFSRNSLLKSFAKHFSLTSNAVGFGDRLTSFYEKRVMTDALGDTLMPIATIKSTKAVNTRLYAASPLNIRTWKSRAEFARARQTFSSRNSRGRGANAPFIRNRGNGPFRREERRPNE